MNWGIRLFTTALLTTLATGCSQVGFNQADQAVQQTNIQTSSILIENGAIYTQSRMVQLSLNSPNAEEMYITNDPDCESGGTWEDYQTRKNWDLGAENQVTSVYVSYKKGDNVVSDCLSDSIEHDDIAPVIESTLPDAKFVSGSSQGFSYNVREDGSGLATVTCIRNGSSSVCQRFDSEDLSSILFDASNADNNKHSIVIQAVDRAGNRADSLEVAFKVLPVLDPQNTGKTVHPESNAPDLLFVLDNSTGTMNYQINNDFHNGFGALNSHLTGLDWRAAMITTDPSAATGADQMRDGQLVAITANPAVGHVIDANMNKAGEKFADTVQSIFDNQHSHKPKAVETSIRAMERFQAGQDFGFFRSNSHLAVVIYTDADEDLEGTETPESKIQEFNASVNSVFGIEKNRTVYSIIRPEGDSSCNQNGNKEGVTYDRLARTTGGIVQSLCAPDFSEVLSQIGRDIEEKIRRVDLACNPYFDPEESVNAVQIFKDGIPVNVAYTLNGATLYLNSALDAGAYEFRYDCL